MVIMRNTAGMVLILCAAVLSGSEPRMSEPKYTEDRQLVRPTGYREWVFVGSSIGMGYQEGTRPEGDRPQFFHNVYIQPEAYRTYAATGKFPNKTMLVMEVVAPGSNASINKQGKFEDKFIGIEAAVKDEARVPEKWAYYSFMGSDGKGLPQAKAFSKDACWSCHNQHAEVDNVFVQFYPVLRESRK
jgi:hypothetical protein